MYSCVRQDPPPVVPNQVKKLETQDHLPCRPKYKQMPNHGWSPASALGAQAQGMLHAKGQKTSAGGFGRWPAQTHGSARARDGANHAPVAVACGSGQEERETEGDGGRQLDKT